MLLLFFFDSYHRPNSTSLSEGREFVGKQGNWKTQTARTLGQFSIVSRPLSPAREGAGLLLLHVQPSGEISSPASGTTRGRASQTGGNLSPLVSGHLGICWFLLVLTVNGRIGVRVVVVLVVVVVDCKLEFPVSARPRAQLSCSMFTCHPPDDHDAPLSLFLSHSHKLKSIHQCSLSSSFGPTRNLYSTILIINPSYEPLKLVVKVSTHRHSSGSLFAH